uniref:Cytochrome c domain-containing protein n=1 Tax=Pinctada fucata TaxID=50426 RepID=A0A194AM94_PINFU
MAAVVNRASRQALLKAKSLQHNQQANFGNFSKRTKNIALGALGLAAAGGTVATAVACGGAVHAATELILHAPRMPWPHQGLFTDFDKRSVKRGYQVYKQVCAACHSLEYVRFREMIGVIFSRDEAKAEAAEFQVLDGPDPEGHMFRRPGLLIDAFPSPYDNVEAAKAANNGVAPPDLSYQVKAAHQGPDYIFSLLTGYRDPPAGVTLMEGVHYNPYYEGGLIAMAQALYDDIIEYDDGTPATQAQLAKDVTTFPVVGL